MDTSQMEQAWLEAVGARLVGSGPALAPPADAEVRSLLRVTKVTADATGVRYLAPLTSYLIGRAAGRAEATGGSFDLRAAVDAISELAAGWEPAPEG
ncbi:MAG: DUF6457 domain-containing protein [Actinomycetota bacterium]